MGEMIIPSIRPSFFEQIHFFLVCNNVIPSGFWKYYATFSIIILSFRDYAVPNIHPCSIRIHIKDNILPIIWIRVVTLFWKVSPSIKFKTISGSFFPFETKTYLTFDKNFYICLSMDDLTILILIECR